jgi:hypothetical protein
MRSIHYGCKGILLFVVLVCANTVSSAANPSNDKTFVLMGSTPGDSLIKTMLSIPTQTAIDFIKWNLAFEQNNVFVLDIVFGVSQPNTLGFKAGGIKKIIRGKYMVTGNGSPKYGKEIYQLKSADGQVRLSLIKISEHSFHLLAPDGTLLNGNGGWSYSLNRKDPVGGNEVLIHTAALKENSTQVIYEGRTPCREIAAEHPEMKVSAACFKLKWQLILNRDAVTYKPTSFSIRKIIDGKAQHVTGKWIIRKGTGARAGQTIYTIEPDKPDASISFLVADDNILFFLNKDDQPYIGNADFSFVLNRKS